MIDTRSVPRENEELQALIAAAWNGELIPGQRDRLDELLLADDEAMEFYLTCMAMHGRLLWQYRGATDQVKQWAADHGASEGLAGDSDRDVRIPAIVPIPCADPSHSLLGSISQGGWMLSYLTATVILGAMLLSAWAYKISHSEQIVQPSTPGVIEDARMECVARITGMKECRPADGESPIFLGSAATLGRKYSLVSGLLEITYRNGARVILEGPCTYKVDSRSGGYLSLGKLTARVDNAKPQAVNPDPRNSSLIPHPSSFFSVTTPTAVVTDLGTEFGVEVEANGNTLSQVFQGSVEVMPIGGDASDAVLLVKDDSIRVEKGAGVGKPVVVRDKITKPSRFVRKIPRLRRNYIDLADIVAGGDGFGRVRNRGIDPVTGGLLDSRDKFDHALKNDGHYHPVDKLPLIDGVFIPDGGQGPVQIDSAEHSYSGFPDTVGESWHFLWSGQLPATEAGRVSCWLKDLNFASARHSVLSMTPNKGITFDLKALRLKHKDVRIVRFTATAGNTEMRSMNRSAARVSADLWVFVDGDLRFSRTDVNSIDGAFDIDIALTGADRFLTLAVTDAGNSTEYDWTIFGDPRLEIASTSKEKTYDGHKPQSTDKPRGKGGSPMQ